MGLFGFGKAKPKGISTKLVSTKKEQATLENLAKFHDPLKVWVDLSDNGNLIIRLGKNQSHPAGKLPAKVVKELEEKYSKPNGLSCSITVGDNYTISKEKDALVCSVVLTIEK